MPLRPPAEPGEGRRRPRTRPLSTSPACPRPRPGVFRCLSLFSWLRSGVISSLQELRGRCQSRRGAIPCARRATHVPHARSQARAPAVAPFLQVKKHLRQKGSCSLWLAVCQCWAQGLASTLISVALKIPLLFYFILLNKEEVIHER